AQAVIYLATAPKSNSATTAISQAREDVRSGRTLQVPAHLRDSHYKGAKSLGHGVGYEYSHDQPTAFSAQNYLPEERTYYVPTGRGFEAEIQKRLDEWDKLRRKPGDDAK